MSLSVLVVDDHEAVRMGLSQMIRDWGHMVHAAVGRGSEALAALSASTCDVVLLDIRLPDNDGLLTLESIRELHEAVPVVILSAYDNLTYVARAAALGASDYLVKNRTGSDVRSCLERAAQKGAPHPIGLMSKVQGIMRDDVDVKTLPAGFPLTGREAQVLKHIALGLSNKEIARSLKISVETVKEHVQNILRKVKAADRTDAAVRAIQSGMV